MDLGLKDRVAIITGSSQGIGKEIARNFAREGAKITICSRNQTTLQKTANKIKNETGSEVLTTQTNLENKQDISKMVKETIKEFGRIDILVNNTGGPPPMLFLETNEKHWVNSVNQLLLSVTNSCSNVIPYMKKNRWGRIINMTSIAAKQPIDNLILSNTIRSGLHGLTKTLSNELAEYGILVNAVCPGYTLTKRVIELAQDIAKNRGNNYNNIIAEWSKLIPLGRFAQAEEIANLVVFYASEKASYITGNITEVDGGYKRGIN